MKYNYLVFALATAALFACTGKEAVDPVAEGELVTIRAYQEGATETRTTLIDGGTQVYWEPSDEIKVFFRGSGSRFTSQNTSNADVAEFSGSLNVVVGINEGASGSNTLWGLYPYRADATSEGESVTTTLPVEQTGRAGSFAKGTHITLAQSNSFDLAFYNVTGGIRFSLTTEGVKEVVFQGQNDENIAGKVKLAFVDGVPAVQEVIDGQKSITLTAPYGDTFETGKWYYIVALPGTLSNGFKMTFNTETQYATLKSSGSKTIKRGIFGTLADADEDLIFKDKGGDEPPVTGNIVFADLAAKYACVAKYDTNGDGEVSIEEAEAVTSFDGLFTDWKGVVSFDEIRYFKNVRSLAGVFEGCNKLVSITIPDNITELGNKAFSKCTSLTSIELPSGITTIESESFQNCRSLLSIDIPSTVRTIGTDAFFNCISLSSIELPSGLTTIESGSFESCASLLSIDIPSTVRTIGSSAFSNCSLLSSIELPSTLTTIGDSAFYACNALSQVSIPDSVTSLGNLVFGYCTNLIAVNLPSGITSIPENCFYECRSLTSVSIPSGIVSVGSAAFYNVSMWMIELPSTVSSLGYDCFGNIVCVILPSTSPISIENGTFSNVGGIFVPSNMVGLYSAMTNWADYASKIHPINTYREKSEFTLATSGAVDMGVSVKWSAYNVGATQPEEAGGYYAWGEIETKYNYSWSTYLDSPTRDGKTFSKYFVGEGGKTTLDLEDDVAFIKWGKNWRIPTEEEWTELLFHCGVEWTSYLGINGHMIYDFDSGNSIFVPAAGYRYNSSLYRNDRSHGNYWSSSLSPYSSGYARYTRLVNPSDSNTAYTGSRDGGLSIRPVYAE